VDWAGTVVALAYPSAALAVLVESVGVPFPGDALLLVVAAWAGARQQPLVLVFLCGFLGGAAGSDVGYVLGRRGGRPFVERFGARLRIRPERLAYAELFFARHGDRAILVSRFVVGLRTWASMLAGMAHMPFWRFQFLIVLGDLAWIAAVVAAGYLVGSNLGLIQEIVRATGVGGVVFIAVMVSVLLLAQERATRRR
jgi:membrane protein DedA with SNARE-associated domain